ncbi:MAG: type II secretion system protein E [Omnitrophica WOR_2 bacterium GWB2_45_9]|nr:MAG: type II secretion system protein E [Omnitrophica WOR_2 bacterium GWB2_45_9]
MSKELKEKVRYRLKEHSHIFTKEKINEQELRFTVARIVEEIRIRERLQLDENGSKKIIDELIDEFMGFGPLKALLEDKAVTEIMVNGPKKVYVEKEGRMLLSDITFENNQHLLYIIQKILMPTRRHVDELSPFTDVSLPDGSRVNIIIPPVSLSGPVITIRKFIKDFSSIEDLVTLDTLSRDMADFLIAAIRAKLNIIFSGATGSGKTTTLNILSGYISARERIVTIEDTAELKLNQEHVVSLEARPGNIEGKGDITIRDLFRNTLRMRPGRIILGEVRSGEALDMLQAMCSGHDGSLAVLHASSPLDVVSRIETMILTSGINIPVWAIKKQIASSLNLIIQQEQLADGSRKITHITEARGLDKDELVLQDLFSYEIEGVEDSKVKGTWKKHGVVPLFFSRFKKKGVELNEAIFKS